MAVSVVGCSAKLSSLNINWPPIAVPVGRTIEKDFHHAFEVSLPIDGAAISAIEQSRPPGESFFIQLNLWPLYTLLEEFSIRKNPEALQPARVHALSHDQSTTTTAMVEISSDKWRKTLKEMGWDELQVFEIPVRGMSGHPAIAAGVVHLRKAQSAFRTGHRETTIIEVRKAIEAAANAVAAEGTERGPALKALVAEVMPRAEDAVRRDLLDALMRAFAEVRHEHAHGGNPEPYHQDAELALSVGVAIFRYMSQSLVPR
jgi:hypothetical protein